MNSALMALALEAFGKQDYKGKQKEIVTAAIQGVDIFVSAPTGMGKVVGVATENRNLLIFQTFTEYLLSAASGSR